MDLARIASELIACRTCFSLGELSRFIFPEVDQGMLGPLLLDDPRYICVRSKPPDEDRFIFEVALFRWFADLNIRLAEAGTFRLGERQVAWVMSHLRRKGWWGVPPHELVRWGGRFGLIAPAYTPGQYAFPLARVLSCLPSQFLGPAIAALRAFGQQRESKRPLDALMRELLQKGFSPFSQRLAHMVKARAGLLTGEKITLQELGASLGYSRERIRQLESEFWAELDSSESRRRPFLVALLADFMNRSGSLLVDASSSCMPMSKFLARCAGIPCVEIPHTGLIALGCSSDDLGKARKSEWFPAEIDADAIAHRLESKQLPWLVGSDVRTLAGRIERFRRRRLKGTQRVYLALRHIGRPAHYSRVAEAHNALFPNQPMSEHNVHAALGRKRYGVVWIGVRGTYALAEWGYERPPRGLYEAATEIVRRIHGQTGQPVPMTVIVAELSKERRIVNRTSLVFATHFNAKLSRVFGDSFIPRDPGDQLQDELSADELDRILREFRDGC